MWSKLVVVALALGNAQAFAPGSRVAGRIPKTLSRVLESEASVVDTSTLEAAYVQSTPFGDASPKVSKFKARARELWDKVRGTRLGRGPIGCRGLTEQRPFVSCQDANYGRYNGLEESEAYSIIKNSPLGQVDLLRPLIERTRARPEGLDGTYAGDYGFDPLGYVLRLVLHRNKQHEFMKWHLHKHLTFKFFDNLSCCFETQVCLVGGTHIFLPRERSEARAARHGWDRRLGWCRTCKGRAPCQVNDAPQAPLGARSPLVGLFSQRASFFVIFLLAVEGDALRSSTATSSIGRTSSHCSQFSVPGVSSSTRLVLKALLSGPLGACLELITRSCRNRCTRPSTSSTPRTTASTTTSTTWMDLTLQAIGSLIRSTSTVLSGTLPLGAAVCASLRFVKMLSTKASQCLLRGSTWSRSPLACTISSASFRRLVPHINSIIPQQVQHGRAAMMGITSWVLFEVSTFFLT